MKELGHRAVSIDDGLQHAHDGVGADSIALRQFINFLPALIRETLHCSPWGIFEWDGRQWSSKSLQ
jgi:hypothetical protein